MAPSGKHARDPQQVRVGKHGVATRSRFSISYVIAAIVLVAVVCLAPFSFAQHPAGIDSQAFADSTRSAFADLDDATSQADADGFPTKPADYTSHAVAKMQNTVMSGGCEVVALGIALDSMGIEADIDKIVKDHLNVDGHFATGYSGSPYYRGAGYPPGIVEAANSYLDSLGVQVRAHNLTGTSFGTVKQLVKQGYPVVVWTTMDLDDPRFAGAFDNGVEWYDNEHCVVFYGIEDDVALVSDPLEGLVKRDLARFADLYSQCGSMALAIF